MTPEQLQTWLEARQEATRAQEAVWIAFRAAARMLPAILADFRRSSDRDLLYLQICRTTLISSVAGVRPSSEIIGTAATVAKFSATVSADIAKSRERTDILLAADAASLAVEAVSVSAEAVDDKKAISLGARATRAAIDAAAHVSGEAVPKSAAAIAADAAFLEANAIPETAPPLWPGEALDKISAMWNEAKTRLTRDDTADWRFWIDWYDALMAGRPQNLDMLTEIALIPPEDWDKGTAHVNAIIGGIVEKHETGEREEPDLRTQLAQLPAAQAVRVQSVKQAMIAHRADLPPTFDAMLGFISLEVERLQQRNVRDEMDTLETRRQIHTLTTLYRAVEQLQGLVPIDDNMEDEDAEVAERLGRLYLRKFKEWPRENADELVDNTYRFGLVAATALALPMVGVSATYALGAGLVVFGGKKLVDTAKSAKELMKPDGGSGP